MLDSEKTNAASGTAPGDGGELPALEAVRPRATTVDGDPAVEIRFDNGAAIRYRAAEGGIEEEWFAPGADESARSHAADPPSGGDGGDGPTGDAPTRAALSDRALCTIGSYLSFDGRRRAEFSWGEANVAVLIGETADEDG